MTGQPLQHRVRLADGREFGPAAMEILEQWAREGRIPASAELIAEDGTTPRPVLDEPQLARLIQAPPTVSTGVSEPKPDTTSTLIPYRNPAALVGYYIGLFSFIPLFGLLLGPAAITLGIIGFVKHRRNPYKKGAAHAWVAIICGAIGLAIGVGVLVAMFYGINPL